MLNIVILLLCIYWVYRVLKWDVETDYAKWIEEQPIKHTKEAYERIALLAPPLVGLSCILHVNFATALIVTFLFLFFTYWTLFDGWYGLKRKRGFFDVGSEDGKDDAITDNFLQKLKPWQHKLLKLGGITISLFLYLKCLL
jgi:hypothetical protein